MSSTSSENEANIARYKERISFWRDEAVRKESAARHAKKTGRARLARELNAEAVQAKIHILEFQRALDYAERRFAKTILLDKDTPNP